MCQRHQWYELSSDGKSDLFLSLPFPPFFPSLSHFVTSLRITRQRKTQQNLNLSKQAEDPWAPTGRCSSYPHHQGGAGHGVGGPLPRRRGMACWAKGEPEVCPLSYLPACGCVSNTARTCKSERLPIHVCIQTGYCQVQVVGPAEQSGKLYT